MGAMTDAVADYDRLTGLKALADSLAKDIDGLDMADKDEMKLKPQLARQFRETLREINEIEGGVDEDDEIAAIIVRNRKPAAD